MLYIFFKYVQSMFSQCIVIPLQEEDSFSDDYYCTGKILCYLIVQNVMLQLVESDVVRRSL